MLVTTIRGISYMIKKIVILKPSKSLNFSESCNAGIKHSSSEKLFIANDDIIISENSLEELAKNTDDQTITGPDSNCNLGFQTNYSYIVRGVQLVPAMILPQVKNIIPEIYKIKVTRNEIIEREWLAYFATMFTRKCLNDIGPLDEKFVYDKEDLDHCVRAKGLGKKFKQIFSSYCFHFGGVSRKRKHQELGLKHDLDTEHNTLYFNNKYNQMNKPLLALYCFDAFEYWDEKSLNKSVDPKKPSGIGGSETQVVLLSRELAKLGWKVKIFNKCLENHMDSCGLDVEYIPFQNFEQYSKLVTYDVLIASRYLNCFDVPFKSKRNIAMIHDVFLIINGWRQQHDVLQDKIDKYFCLSNAHKQFVSQYHSIPLNQILMTSNGLDFSRFENKNIKKNPYKMIYSSSPDRGLEVLLDLFPRVKQMVPEVTLDIFYGFENFRDQVYVKKMLEKINKTLGVTYHGRVGQNELAEHFLESSIWAYSSGFSETFCITALEAMASEAVVLSSAFWGLLDVVKDGGILLPMHQGQNTVYTQEYQNKWVEECIKILKDTSYAEYWRQQGKQRVVRFTWTNVAKQWDTYFKTGNWNEIQ